MMKLTLTLSVLLLVQKCGAPPVSNNKEEEMHSNQIDEEDDASIFEYQRYLTEVVETLESDPKFREKLQNADEADIRTGKIANKLDLVNRHIRTKLDEIKRRELERLRHLATKEFELSNNLDLNRLKPEHLDHSNPHTFEIDDLKKLIVKTTQHLAETNKKRHAEFKEYEMQKKFDEQQKMKELTEEERKKYAEELERMKEQHSNHAPLHHPGSKQQLEEVWKNQDDMKSQEFDPKTFFYMHDIDNNGVWDPDEVKALFIKELSKMYTPGAPEDDPMEKEEEMERMREYVFNEADFDKNGLIDIHEFLTWTKDPKFQQDPGWKSIDEQQIYTHEEYALYEKHRQQEIQQQNGHGIASHQQLPHNPHQPQNYQVPAGQEQVHQQHYQVSSQYDYPPDNQHHGQMGQSVYQQLPQQQQNISSQQHMQPLNIKEQQNTQQNNGQGSQAINNFQLSGKQ